MNYFPFPAWYYVATCVAALLIGVGIRRYLDHRKRREGERRKKTLEELKKQQKRYKKIMKKAGRK